MTIASLPRPASPPHGSRNLARSLAIMLLALSPFIARSSALAQNAASQNAFAVRVRPLLAKHCFECHGEETHEKDLRLDQLAKEFNTADAAKWQRVLERIQSGQMPPESSPRPSANDTHGLTTSIKDEFRKVELARRAKEGRVVLRRLNRVEYENTVRDL